VTFSSGANGPETRDERGDLVRSLGERTGRKSGVGSGVGGCIGSRFGAGARRVRWMIGIGIGVGIGMSSAGSARSLARWLRAAVDSRLWRWGTSVQRGVRVLSAGRNTGSGADSVDAVEVVGSALIFWSGSEKERNFSATGSVS
jgi:hypothetical protein